ncbi:Elf1-domain-containing protein [Hanseniaspora valbyensis NRRL Y-1626]|uniref:Transcription elongation factor 1 homolog n=1 Tax=Hanseniaspora valbyensis NRRL Y-1626 TaxID=766949 RepID=A0A1B7TED5_9ASCO|nr:Elf1-domain-containing protein [Hanseniaspora valbyensis NRRL Y-1626]
MAKKKSSRKPVKKLKVRLDTSFDCPFCNHNKCITVSLDKRVNMIGSLHCNKCNVSFESKVNVLSEPVDVFTDWIDAVEAVNDPKNKDVDGDSGPRRQVGSDSDSDDSDLYDSDSDEEEVGKSSSGSGAAHTSNNHKRVLEDDDDDEEYDEDFVVKDDDETNLREEQEEEEEDEDDKPVIKKRRVIIEDDEE